MNAGPDPIQMLDLKQRKEEFVSGLTGGPVWEIYACTLVAAASYYTWCTLQSRLSFFDQGFTARFLDIALTWLALLLSFTLYSNRLIELNLAILLPGIIVSLLNSTRQITTSPQFKKNLKESPAKIYLPKLSFLTVYRGGMMVTTCLAILAVDFRVFPRKFAKVETWGTSLMDMGVGSFVFSMGLVSARATLMDSFLDQRTSRFAAMAASFRQALSVLGLGLIRLVLVKSFDYQEHVTEYGVHWNFFITLGLLPPFVSLFDMFPKRIPLIGIALGIGCIYELALNKTGLLSYLITAERTNILSQNREGIFSFIGYLSIFLCGKATGYYALPAKLTIKSYFFPQSKSSLGSSSSSKYIHKFAMLLITGSILQFFYYISRHVLRLSVSRRFANLPYILFVCSYNLIYLSIFILIEIFVFGTPDSIPYNQMVPETLESVNSNGLAIFLLANVSTGLVNLYTNTLDADRVKAIAILVMYSAGLGLVSMIMWKKGIVIKL